MLVIPATPTAPARRSATGRLAPLARYESFRRGILWMLRGSAGALL